MFSWIDTLDAAADTLIDKVKDSAKSFFEEDSGEKTELTPEKLAQNYDDIRHSLFKVTFYSQLAIILIHVLFDSLTINQLLTTITYESLTLYGLFILLAFYIEITKRFEVKELAKRFI